MGVDGLMELPLPPSTPVQAGTHEASAETVTFAASGPVFEGGRRWNAFMTPRKVVLWREVGLISPKKVTQEVDPMGLSTVGLHEEGSFLKEYFLQMDGVTLKGRKSDLENIYRGIQAIRSSTQ